MTVPVEPGTLLAGKLRIENVIAQGGMGVVVSAHHLKLDQRVAVKFLLPEALAHPDALARFEREARAAAKIQNEHTVRVIDVGTLEGGAPYMVMEYLHGCDLRTLLRDRGALPVEDAVDYVLQAAEAIAEAHTLGIVHRDLKPSNLFLTERPDGTPCVKVLDFGISKVSSTSELLDEASLTRTGAVLGSPLYMSPEQLYSSRNADMRTDIWALGAILFEMLAGRPPFVAESIPELIAAVNWAHVPSLRTLRPDLPDGLEYAVEGCLERDLTRRIPSVAELASRLAPYAPKSSRVSVDRILRVSQASGLAMSVMAPPSSGSPSGDQTSGELVRTNHVLPHPRRYKLVAVLGVCAAVLAVLAIYWAKRTPVEWSRVGVPAAASQVSGASVPSAASDSPAAPPASIVTADAGDRQEPDAGAKAKGEANLSVSRPSRSDVRSTVAATSASSRTAAPARTGGVPGRPARKMDPLGGRL